MNYLWLLLIPVSWFIAGGVFSTLLGLAEDSDNSFIAGGLFFSGFLSAIGIVIAGVILSICLLWSFE